MHTFNSHKGHLVVYKHKNKPTCRFLPWWKLERQRWDNIVEDQKMHTVFDFCEVLNISDVIPENCNQIILWISLKEYWHVHYLKTWGSLCCRIIKTWGQESYYYLICTAEFSVDLLCLLHPMHHNLGLVWCMLSSHHQVYNRKYNNTRLKQWKEQNTIQHTYSYENIACILV